MSIEKRTEGFGSNIAKITRFVRADIAADKIAKALGYDDCGCSKRAESLNDPELLVNKIFYKNKDNNEDIKKQDS